MIKSSSHYTVGGFLFSTGKIYFLWYNINMSKPENFINLLFITRNKVSFFSGTCFVAVERL